MRFIDVQGKTPVNTATHPDFPDWSPWTKEKWQKWLARSEEYKQELDRLHQADDRKVRNKFIDDHSAHWGKLKIWLKVLSDGKCWFSEVRELYSHYDVEHFRPKKETKILDGTVRDGYWWLAFDYTNFRLCGNVGNRKKGGWFPLQEYSLLSTYERQCEESEDPYFLDPTKKGDVDLIAFDEEGKAIPLPGISGWEKERVLLTIKRLKLNLHTDLAEERRKIWQKVSSEIEGFQEAKSKCSLGGNPAMKERLEAHCRNIIELTSCQAELSSVAKCCVFFRNDIQLSRLVAS